jgi:hypothetical protein
MSPFIQEENDNGRELSEMSHVRTKKKNTRKFDMNQGRQIKPKQETVRYL